MIPLHVKLTSILHVPLNSLNTKRVLFQISNLYRVVVFSACMLENALSNGFDTTCLSCTVDTPGLSVVILLYIQYR